MIYAICIIVSLIIGYAIGVRATLIAVERRAIQMSSDLLLKSVRSFLKSEKKD